MSILAEIMDAKREELATTRAQAPLAGLEVQAKSAPPCRDFRRALTKGPSRIRVIAEFKRASPSAGAIRARADVADIAPKYEDAGAAALSILTESRYFDGDLSFLARAREQVSIPLLRKDFLFDPYQVIEARAAGADAILLIVAALSDGQLGELLSAAREWGLATLVEVHNVGEAERAAKSGAEIIGVDHRNLKTFEIDMSLTDGLRPLMPTGTVLVGESGIRSAADLTRLADAGASAALIGESFMRADDPGQALLEMLRGVV